MSFDVKGVVFDLDATLVNLGGFVKWNEAYFKAIEIYKACGCSEDLILECSKKGLFQMMNEIRDNISYSLEQYEVEDIQEKVYKAVEFYELEGIKNCQLLPGCPEILVWLRSRGILIGLVTNNSQRVAEEILRQKRLRRYFTSVVGRRPDLRLKPHPAQILKCLEEMELEPKFGVMVGDSPKDIEAAKSIDLFTIAIPSHFTRLKSIKEAGADIIIDNLGELSAVLRVHFRKNQNKFLRNR
jgi:HAD superfamily hydrolase (TIGR01549 family)